MAAQGGRQQNRSQLGEMLLVGGLGAFVLTPVVYWIRTAGEHTSANALWPTWWMIVPLLVAIAGAALVFLPDVVRAPPATPAQPVHDALPEPAMTGLPMRVLTVLLAILATLALVGCGSNGPSQAELDAQDRKVIALAQKQQAHARIVMAVRAKNAATPCAKACGRGACEARGRSDTA